MNRRALLQSGLAMTLGVPLWAAVRQERFDDAALVLASAVERGEVAAAVLHVAQRKATFTRTFGKAKSDDAMFLLGSISKPIAVTALMTLYDQGEFKLDDTAQHFLPTFTGRCREKVTIRQLLTHVSGLPDQLAENNALRKKHAPLSEFVEHALRTPLAFVPGTRFQYSSMAILLAAHIAEKISGTDILTLVERSVLAPLKMQQSAQGLGRFKQEEMIAVQTEHAAPESGGGDPTAKEWDWNSEYWRKLGAPWGGTHASAPDIGKFLAEFLYAQGRAVKPDTARQMITNQNSPGITPRGLGFNIGAAAGSRGCSEQTFGHTGSTGTVCWADAATETICVVLTSLPGRAVQPHPRDVAAEKVANV